MHPVAEVFPGTAEVRTEERSELVLDELVKGGSLGNEVGTGLLQLLHVGLEEAHGTWNGSCCQPAVLGACTPIPPPTGQRDPGSNQAGPKLLLTARASPPLVRGPGALKIPLRQLNPTQILTDAGDYPEKVIHLLVHSCGDDPYPGESIGD